LCLLLAVLFLYNPFLAVPANGSGLQVRHSVSNRATLGASELQHFTAKERHVFPPESGCLIGDLLFGNTPVLEMGTFGSTETRLPKVAWPVNLWFRPPPIE
jgi:hypothetical protein